MRGGPPDMMKPPTFLRHNVAIEEQRRGRGARLGELVAGHKKDIVVTTRWNDQPNRLALYGMHRPGSGPVQRLSVMHGLEYLDYTQGVRLILRAAQVDGVERSIDEILAEDDLFAAIFDER